MELKKVNKQAMFRIFLQLYVDHKTGKKEIDIKNITCFGLNCLKYAHSDWDVFVEDLAIKELKNNPARIIDHLQFYENSTIEFSGQFLCTAMFDPKTKKYIRCNWKLDNLITHVLDEDDLKALQNSA